MRFELRTLPNDTPSRPLAAPHCPSCGRDMRLRWRVADPHSGTHDLAQFFCSCGAQCGDKIAREPGEDAVA